MDTASNDDKMQKLTFYSKYCRKYEFSTQALEKIDTCQSSSIDGEMQVDGIKLFLMLLKKKIINSNHLIKSINTKI